MWYRMPRSRTHSKPVDFFPGRSVTPTSSVERFGRHSLLQPGSLSPGGVASATAEGELVSEIVVVDDGSTDETPTVATRDRTVRYLRQERSGLSEARNSGWRASSGDYVIFLDADDRLLPVRWGRSRGVRPLASRRLCFRTLRTHRRAGAVLPTWRELPDQRTTGRSPQETSSSSSLTAAAPGDRRATTGQRLLHGDAATELRQHARGGRIPPRGPRGDGRLRSTAECARGLRDVPAGDAHLSGRSAMTRSSPSTGGIRRRCPCDTLNMLRMALFVLHEQRPYLAEHPGATRGLRGRTRLLEAPLRQAVDAKCAEPSRSGAAAPGRQCLPVAARARGRWRTACAAGLGGTA